MAVEPRDGGHGVGGKASEDFVQQGIVAGGAEGMVEVEAVAVEFGDAGGGDDDAVGVAGFDDVEGEEEGVAEVADHAVVGGGGKGEEVGQWSGLGDSYGTTGCLDGEAEERLSCWGCHCD